MGYYGHPRATGDLDLWVAVDARNAAAFAEMVRGFGFDVPELTLELFLQPNRVIRMGIPPVRIEVLTGIDGVPVDLISLADLKTNKRASGRLQDLDDVKKLP